LFVRPSAPMEYKRFTIKTIEREPGKWRASIQRANGRPLWAGRAKIRHFVTGIDATTPQRAMHMALAAIDRRPRRLLAPTSWCGPGWREGQGAAWARGATGVRMVITVANLCNSISLAWFLAQQLRQLRHVGRNPPRLVVVLSVVLATPA
jgi:hypothetical protein